MAHIKIITLQTGRTVKLTFDDTLRWEEDDQKIEGQIQVTIRERNEEKFHPPIGMNHPRYWKLKRSGAEHAARLQLAYSGLSSKQISSAIKEYMSSVILHHSSKLY